MHEETITFLRRAPLANIVPLKMLAAHPEQITVHLHKAGASTAALLLFPPQAFAYDRQSYPDDAWIALIVTSEPDAIDALIPLLPSKQRILFKLADPQLRAHLSRHLPLQRITGFASYTSTAQDLVELPPATADIAVVEAAQVDPALYPFFAAQGHDAADLDHYFAGELGRLFACQVAGEIVAACFTYQNFETIHEIGGVFTIPHARRKGYAKLVVQAALVSLHKRGLTPRYQVHEENLASIQLAEALGLARFALVEHWRYCPPEVTT